LVAFIIAKGVSFFPPTNKCPRRSRNILKNKINQFQLCKSICYSEITNLPRTVFDNNFQSKINRIVRRWFPLQDGRTLTWCIGLFIKTHTMLAIKDKFKMNLLPVCRIFLLPLL
jgi:hypothetical protein